MTQTMRAAVLEGPQRFSVAEVPLPEPGPGEVLIRLEGCGVCASNLTPWAGPDWMRFPTEPGGLGHEGWGVVDAVGSHTLANACAQVRYGGAVAACGLAQGMDLPASVAPFILRGVALLGVDSVMAPRALRQTAWQRLAADLLPDRLAAITREVTLSEAIDAAHDIVAGKMRGRVVVDVNR